ncbi:hypothetical protein ABK040_008733 [Willaertia magna]
MNSFSSLLRKSHRFSSSIKNTIEQLQYNFKYNLQEHALSSYLKFISIEEQEEKGLLTIQQEEIDKWLHDKYRNVLLINFTKLNFISKEHLFELNVLTSISHFERLTNLLGLCQIMFNFIQPCLSSSNANNQINQENNTFSDNPTIVILSNSDSNYFAFLLIATFLSFTGDSEILKKKFNDGTVGEIFLHLKRNLNSKNLFDSLNFTTSDLNQTLQFPFEPSLLRYCKFMNLLFNHTIHQFYFRKMKLNAIGLNVLDFIVKSSKKKKISCQSSIYFVIKQNNEIIFNSQGIKPVKRNLQIFTNNQKEKSAPKMTPWNLFQFDNCHFSLLGDFIICCYEMDELGSVQQLFRITYNTIFLQKLTTNNIIYLEKNRLDIGHLNLELNDQLKVMLQFEEISSETKLGEEEKNYRSELESILKSSPNYLKGNRKEFRLFHITNQFHKSQMKSILNEIDYFYKNKSVLLRKVEPPVEKNYLPLLTEKEEEESPLGKRLYSNVDQEDVKLSCLLQNLSLTDKKEVTSPSAVRCLSPIVSSPTISTKNTNSNITPIRLRSVTSPSSSTNKSGGKNSSGGNRKKRNTPQLRKAAFLLANTNNNNGGSASPTRRGIFDCEDKENIIPSSPTSIIGFRTPTKNSPLSNRSPLGVISPNCNNIQQSQQIITEEKDVKQGFVPPPPVMFNNSNVSNIPTPPPLFKMKNMDDSCQKSKSGFLSIPPPPIGTPTMSFVKYGGIPPSPTSCLTPKSKSVFENNFKNLHWKPIKQIKEQENSIWSNKEIDINEEIIDLKEFEKFFSKVNETQMSVKKKRESCSFSNVKKVNESTSVIDINIARNIEIILNSQFKLMTNQEIVNAINNLNIDKLNSSQIENLQKVNNLTSAEILKRKDELLQNRNTLSKTDNFLLDLHSVPHLDSKLSLMNYFYHFDNLLEGLSSKIENKMNAVQILQTSTSLAKVLKYVLTVGNYMNRGKRQLEEANGFHVSILPKLIDTKSTIDKGLNLMHYLATILEKDQIDVYYFEKELENAGVCTVGVSITFEVMDLQLKELKDIFEHVERLNNQLKEDKAVDFTECYKEKLMKFNEKLSERLPQVSERYESLQSTYNACCDYFHFTKSNSSTNANNNTATKTSTLDSEDEFFVYFKDFIQQYKKAKKENEERKLKEMKLTLQRNSSLQNLKKRKTINGLCDLTDSRSSSSPNVLALR